MKKIVIILIMTFVINTNTSGNLHAATSPHEEQASRFLDAQSPIMQDYEDKNNESPYLDEYDKNITDNVVPVKVGRAEALFKEALGAVLIRYITFKELARSYFNGAKDTMAQWYNKIIN